MRRLLLVACFALSAFAADITGKWNASVELDAGSGSPVFVLKQDGNKITGTYSGALGEATVAGTVEGSRIEFYFDVDAGGDKVTAVYAGTLESEKKMKGTVKIGSLGSGTFTAVKE